MRQDRSPFHLNFREIGGLLEASAAEWMNDNAQRLGAALAFYTLLSFAPLLVVVVGVAALVYGKDAAGGQLAWEIRNVVGWHGAKIIQSTIDAAYNFGSGTLATCLSLAALFFGASSVVVELRDDLNNIWKAPSPTEGANLTRVLRIVKERFYSFALVLGAGFLLLITLTLGTWLSGFGNYFESHWRVPESLVNTALFLISFFVITLLFAAVYKTMPDVNLKWSDVAVGAGVTALIFTIGKQLISLYLAKATVASTYGAAGSLVILLLWVYYSAQLFFFGAEFTKVYTRRFGSRAPEPSDSSRALGPDESQPASPVAVR